MSLSRSKRSICGKFFPDNTVYKQVREALLESGTIVCDGVYYQADCHPGEIMINSADVEKVLVTNLDPSGRAFVMNE